MPTRWACRSGVCHTCVTPLLSGRGMPIADQLARHTHKIPDELALTFEGSHLSYRELDERVCTVVQRFPLRCCSRIV